ncbi:MAG: 4-alpha-glucanotransferase [Candidatus Omnitrophota bacterium]
MELLDTASREKWLRIGTQRRSGVLVPLFSLYSKKSLGIGELDDLKILVDWCEKTGNSIIQILPMNEVACHFCPYETISSFALEPSYLRLENIPGSEKYPVQAGIRRLRELFPAGRDRVDYRIKPAKSEVLREIYRTEGCHDLEGLEKFKEENSYWVNGFGLFKVLKDEHRGRAWYEWDEPYKNRDPLSLEAFYDAHKEEIEFHVWVQWLLCERFKEVKEYAESRGVLIKGDLPILVARDSADVWAHPEFFKLEFAAGAPPDMFCAKGQRWGNPGTPTYNWERISSDGYRYLKERLRYAEHFYDIVRIDHIVGLFRIWSIFCGEPLENEGLNGFFDPPDEREWEEHGRKILEVMLDSTKMLLCGEDLGVIPSACPKTLRRLGIPGIDIQRWTKDWHGTHGFRAPDDYRLVSVATLSTHDTTNWVGWWENEAGTVDEAFFQRRCSERGIDYPAVKNRLFDCNFFRHGRLRWSQEVNSVETLVSILGKPKDSLWDFIEMYRNTSQEKENFWEYLNLESSMRESADLEIISGALKFVLGSRSIFCINLMLDWLNLAGLFNVGQGFSLAFTKEDQYHYRINTPGTVSDQNWSLVLPVSLEQLLEHEICGRIRDMVTSSHRQ